MAKRPSMIRRRRASRIHSATQRKFHCSAIHGMRSIFLLGVSGGRPSESTAARRFDHEEIAGRHFHGRGGAELLSFSIRPHHIIATHRTGLAARKAKRSNTPAVGKDGCAHLVTEAELSYRAVAAVEAALSSRAAPNREFLEQNGKTRLQNFGIGQT